MHDMNSDLILSRRLIFWAKILTAINIGLVLLQLGGILCH